MLSVVIPVYNEYESLWRCTPKWPRSPRPTATNRDRLRRRRQHRRLVGRPLDGLAEPIPAWRSLASAATSARRRP